MLELGTNVTMLLLGLVVGAVLFMPKVREVIDSMNKTVAGYVLLTLGLFIATALLGWAGLAVCLVGFLLYVVFGLRDIRALEKLWKKKEELDAAEVESKSREEKDDDVIVQLVTDFDADDDGDGATPQGIRQLALERNVVVPPGALDDLVEKGRLVKLASGRYRAVGFSDANTDPNAPLAPAATVTVNVNDGTTDEPPEKPQQDAAMRPASKGTGVSLNGEAPKPTKTVEKK